jgi:hypothetical protein
MARSRNIKPGFFTNEELARLPDAAQLLFAGLWTIADRDGRLEDRPARINAQIFPYKKRNVDRLLDDLAGARFIVRYESAGGRYIQVLNFLRHQTPHVKEPASTIPEPDLSQSLISPVCLATYRGNQDEGKGNQESGGAAKFSPPTVAEVAAHCAERANGIDAEAFVAHYASKGWRVGRSPMKDWKSAVTTWEKNKGQFSGVNGTNGTPPRNPQADQAKRAEAIRKAANDAAANDIIKAGLRLGKSDEETDLELTASGLTRPT